MVNGKWQSANAELLIEIYSLIYNSGEPQKAQKAQRENKDNNKSFFL
jgi:hypothetical protein